MFLRSKICRKNGKEHRAWSVVENRRVHDGRVVQRQVFYLGEINDSQRAAWSKAIEIFDEGAGQSKQIALFPEDRLAPVLDCDVVSIRLNAMRLRRPRQWGACWMATLLWDQLRLDEFWLAALPPSREGTRWLNILKTLVSYQLIVSSLDLNPRLQTGRGFSRFFFFTLFFNFIRGFFIMTTKRESHFTIGINRLDQKYLKVLEGALAGARSHERLSMCRERAPDYPRFVAREHVA